MLISPRIIVSDMVTWQPRSGQVFYLVMDDCFLNSKWGSPGGWWEASLDGGIVPPPAQSRGLHEGDP